MIHLINPLDALGGSELRTLELQRQLAVRAEVELWSEGKPLPALTGRAPIQRIDLPAGRLPRDGGTVVFVGNYFSVGGWIQKVRPRRVVLIHNLLDTRGLLLLLLRLRRAGWPPPELVFCSRLAADQLGQHLLRLGVQGEQLLPGWPALLQHPVVHTSLVDLQRLRPAAGQRRAGPLRLGRHSRDLLAKHHPQDPALYRRAVDQGWQVRLLGASCLSPLLQGVPGVELLPLAAEAPQAFLPNLDVFYYRTAPSWTEPSGRVVLEAMACGLPVLCERRGGYCEDIHPGDSGLLFADDQEADHWLAALASDPHLRARLGVAARAHAERLCSGPQLEAQLGYYLS